MFPAVSLADLVRPLAVAALAVACATFSWSPTQATTPVNSTAANVAPNDDISPDVLAAARAWRAGDKNAKTTLEGLARRGRADAQEVLGEILETELGNQPSQSVVACAYFQQASSTRSDALHNLAFCAEKGVGGQPDLVRSAKLYGQAADEGYPKSMCALGNLYIQGRGVDKDVTRGASLCRKGAEAGDRDAQTDLGNLYLEGTGVPHDMVQARVWYEKAAVQGQANAELVLGQIYWNGDGVGVDRDKAAELWRSAYKHGRVDAARMLGMWATARWMAAHPSGDFSMLDEAIRWDEAALAVAHTDKEKADAEAQLTMVRALRDSGTEGEAPR